MIGRDQLDEVVAFLERQLLVDGELIVQILVEYELTAMGQAHACLLAFGRPDVGPQPEFGLIDCLRPRHLGNQLRRRRLITQRQFLGVLLWRRFLGPQHRLDLIDAALPTQTLEMAGQIGGAFPLLARLEAGGRRIVHLPLE